MKHTIKLEFDQYLLEHFVVVIFFDKKINKWSLMRKLSFLKSFDLY